MTTPVKHITNILRCLQAFSPAASARAARCTNAAAFVHKTSVKSDLESLGTRLSETIQNLPAML
jgi:plasmid replication initiation protein